MKLYGISNLIQKTQKQQAWSLLTYAMQETCQLPNLPPVERPPDGRGKPCFPSRPDCQFNLSHSGCFALCGLDARPVGVDIQIVKSNWHSKLPQRVCAPEELDWLNTQPDRWNAFTLLWTLKESRVKQDGRGLTVSIPSISIPLPNPTQTLYQQGGLYFRIYSGPGWFASMCGHAPPPQEILWLNANLTSYDKESAP